LNISKLISKTLKLFTGPALWLLVGFFALYFLTSAFDFFISDGEVMYQTSREIALRGQFDQPANPALPQIIEGRNGLHYSKYGLGQPVIAAGFFKFGKWLWFTFMREKWDEPIAHFAVTLLPLVVTALSVWLVYLFGKRLYGSVKIGIGLALLYGLGTSAWPYSHFFFSEPLFGFCSLAAAYALFRVKDSPKPWLRYAWLLLGGFALGYAILTRVSGVALVPAYLFYLWLIGKPNPPTPFPKAEGGVKFLVFKRNVRGLGLQYLVFGVGIVPAMAMTAFYNWLRFGNPLSSGYEGEGFTTPIWEGLWGLLFSTGKSVFAYSPVLIALPFALKPFIKRAKPEALFFSTLLGITVIYYSVWWAWYGGFSWGPRFLVPILPFAILALGALLEKGRVWAIVLFVGLLPLSIFVQMLGVAVNFNTHLGNITHFQPGWDADYNFIPAFSPLRGHFELFWQPQNNVIRALTLEQLGLNQRMSKIFTLGAWAGFVLALIMVSYVYLRTFHQPKNANADVITIPDTTISNEIVKRT